MTKTDAASVVEQIERAEQLAELARVEADFAWWEEAFGKGNVSATTYRYRATVNWAGKPYRPVDAGIRNWIINNAKIKIDRDLPVKATRVFGMMGQQTVACPRMERSQ